MSNLNLSKIAKDVQSSITKHSPEILTGIGIAGMITTTILAVRATPKALSCMETEKNKQNYKLAKEARDNCEESCEHITKLKASDVIRVTWKCYIPAVVTGAVSIACLIGASSVNAKRNAALATAYKLTETAFADYKEKVVETIGEKKEKEVKDKIAEKKVTDNPVSKADVIITKKGDVLCLDAVFGKYFKSDIDQIKRAQNAINREININGYASLNDFYDELDVSHIPLGDELGWNTDSGLLDVYFSAQLSEDDEPCIVFNYNVAPKYKFDMLY